MLLDPSHYESTLAECGAVLQTLNRQLTAADAAGQTAEAGRLRTKIQQEQSCANYAEENLVRARQQQQREQQRQRS